MKGVPRLVIVKGSDGTVIELNANKKVQEEGPAVIEEWLGML